MITLPEKLRKNGFQYSLVLRGERSCIFQQEVAPNLTCYEVFLIRIRQERIIRIDFQEKLISAREVFPSNEDFGQSAWAYRDYNKAFERYLELEKNGCSERIL